MHVMDERNDVTTGGGGEEGGSNISRSDKRREKSWEGPLSKVVTDQQQP